MAKSPARFLALLRGINVGGRNIIGRDDLRACFEDMEFTSVRTYIQSGNILFRSEQTRTAEITRIVEAGLSERFDYDARAVILSHRMYKSAVASAPEGWGTDDGRKHNAMFTLRSTTPREVLASLPAPVPGIEHVATGPGVIFWSVSREHQSRTTMMKLAKEPAYRQLTVRNHNTVFRLLELFAEIQAVT